MCSIPGNGPGGLLYFARGTLRLRWRSAGRSRRQRGADRVFGDQPSRRAAILSGSAKRCDVALWLLSWRGGAERRPFLHEPPPLLKQIAAPVCLFNLIANDVREGRLRNFVLKRRALAGPRFEGGAEAVRRQIASAHATHKHQKRHVGERRSRLAAGENKRIRIIVAANPVHTLQDVERPRGKRDAVFATRLHACSRYRPSLVKQVHLAPTRADYFTRARSREGQKFQGFGCDALLLS